MLLLSCLSGDGLILLRLENRFLGSYLFQLCVKQMHIRPLDMLSLLNCLGIDLNELIA